MPFFQPGQIGAQRARALRRWCAAWPCSSSKSAARLLRAPALRRARAVLLFVDQAADCAPAARRAVAFLAQPFEFQPRHRQARIGAREFFGQLAMLVIERQRFLLAAIAAARAGASRSSVESGDFAIQLLQPRGRLVHALAAWLATSPVSSRSFALQRQRTAAGLLAAADGMAVIADAIGQQEIEIADTGPQGAAPPRDPPPGSRARAAAAGPAARSLKPLVKRR